MSKPTTIMIDDVEYVRKDSISKPAVNTQGMEYCIVRCDRSGVFAGYVETSIRQEAVVLDARRLWYWKGAATLSQLAVDGVLYPKECKFPMEVPKVLLKDVIEIIPCSEKARKSIKGVNIWKI